MLTQGHRPLHGLVPGKRRSALALPCRMILQPAQKAWCWTSCCSSTPFSAGACTDTPGTQGTLQVHVCCADHERGIALAIADLIKVMQLCLCRVALDHMRTADRQRAVQAAQQAMVDYLMTLTSSSE